MRIAARGNAAVRSRYGVETLHGYQLTELVLRWVLPIGLVILFAVVCYLGLLAYVYLRAQAGHELYLFVRREVRGMQKAIDEGTEVEGMKNWEELEDMLRAMLEREKILKRRKKKPSRPSA